MPSDLCQRLNVIQKLMFAVEYDVLMSKYCIQCADVEIPRSSSAVIKESCFCMLVLRGVYDHLWIRGYVSLCVHFCGVSGAHMVSCTILWRVYHELSICRKDHRFVE